MINICIYPVKRELQGYYNPIEDMDCHVGPTGNIGQRSTHPHHVGVQMLSYVNYSVINDRASGNAVLR